MNRYGVMLLLFLGTVAVPPRLAPGAPRDTDARAVPTPAAFSVDGGAMEGGAWRASQLLGPYFTVAPDSRSPRIPRAESRPADWRPGIWLKGESDRDPTLVPANGHATAAWVDALGGLTDPAEGARGLRRALDLAASGRVDAAVAAFDDVARAAPWLSDWANFYAAEALATTGDTAVVRRRLEAAGPVLSDGRGWRFKVQAARSAGDLKSARRMALEAARSSTTASGRAAAWVLLGSLRLEAGDTAGAREAYGSAMHGSPGSVSGVDAARHLSRLSPTPEEWRKIASIFLRHGNTARAISGVEAYLASGAGTAAERGQAGLLLGRVLLEAGRFQEAERRMLALADSGPVPRIAAEALYLAGRAQHRQLRIDDARRTWSRTAARFPDQDGTARAMLRLGNLQHEDGDMEGARESYRRAAAAAPTLPEGGIALLRLGGLLFLEGDHHGALAAFDGYRQNHARGDQIGQADYWTARAYLALDREADARVALRAVRARDPLSYYGIRAAELLGEPALAFVTAASPPHRPEATALVDRAMPRIETLASLGRRADLALEVDQLRAHLRRYDGGEYALAEALVGRGHTLMGLAAGWEIQRREGEWNRRLLRIVYPFPFQSLVLAESQAQGVDPYLVAAVIRRESAFNPDARSAVGALGLMQIMPATGRGLAREAGMQGFAPTMLSQPGLNVQFGVRYLDGLLRQFNGDLSLVLSAYNAGPSRAVRWRQFPEHKEPSLFMERIPFNETREYLRNVKIHLAVYRELYPELNPVDFVLAD
jgi:soluble lytic murein transglycosylase